jgi:hypothetical protein
VSSILPHLPAERSKNHRAHCLRLPEPALALLRQVEPRGRDQIFGVRGKAGFSDWSDCKAALDRRLGAPAPWQLRDIRRTAATGMADIGVQPHIVEAVLNHYSGHRAGIAGVYNRARYSAEVTAALARWAAHVTALVTGQVDEKVVPLHA